MKRIYTFLTAVIFSAAVFAAAPKTIDLTKLGATMQYSQVYNMLMEADQYKNVRIKMDGIFYENADQKEGPLFQCIMVSDVTACCMAGFDLIKADPSIIYPEHLTKIEVTGTFEVHETDGVERSYLVIDTLKVIP